MRVRRLEVDGDVDVGGVCGWCLRCLMHGVWIWSTDLFVR